MEVVVRQTSGIDFDAVVSVKSGSTRRQTPLYTGSPNNLLHSRPLAFPQLPLNGGPLSVDLLKPVSTSKLNLVGTADVYSILFPTAQVGQQMTMELEVRAAPHLCGIAEPRATNVPLSYDVPGSQCVGVAGDDAPEAPPSGSDAAADARAYLARFNLLGFVQEMLQYLIREKPEEPFVVMAAYLRKLTGYEDDRRWCQLYKEIPEVPGEERQLASVPDPFLEDTVAETITRQNLRLDEENERLREEIAQFRTICESLPCVQDTVTALDGLAMVRAAAAALEGVLSSKYEELDGVQRATFREGPPDVDREELKRALNSFCHGFSELANRLACAMSSEGSQRTQADLEAAAAAANARLETENAELGRQLLALERTMAVPGDAMS